MDEVVDNGLNDEPDDMTEVALEAERPRLAKWIALSTESRLLLLLLAPAPIEDAVEPERTVGNLIVEGRPSPRMLRFFLPSDCALASG